MEEVRAARAEQLVAPRQALHDVGTRRSGEPVVARRAADRPGAGDGDSGQQTHEDESEKAHGLSRTSAATPSLHVADYDPLS